MNTVACFRIEDDERAAVEKAEMLDDFKKALQGVAEGDAPTIELRTMALRALKGVRIHAYELDSIIPTRGELAELNTLHRRARLRITRH